jgi:hypothetical protein
MSGFSILGFNLYDSNFSTDIPDLQRSRIQQPQRGMNMPTFRGAEGFYQTKESIPHRAITAPPADRMPRYRLPPSAILFTNSATPNQGAEQVETRKQVAIQEAVVKKAIEDEEAAKRVVRQIILAQAEAKRIEKVEIDQATQAVTTLEQRKKREEQEAIEEIARARKVAMQKEAERLALAKILDEKKTQESRIRSVLNEGFKRSYR